MRFVATWMELKTLIQSEVSWKQKDRQYRYHLHVESKTWHKWCTTKQKQIKDIEAFSIDDGIGVFPSLSKGILSTWRKQYSHLRTAQELGYHSLMSNSNLDNGVESACGFFDLDVEALKWYHLIVLIMSLDTGSGPPVSFSWLHWSGLGRII